MWLADRRHRVAGQADFAPISGVVEAAASPLQVPPAALEAAPVAIVETTTVETTTTETTIYIDSSSMRA